MDNPPGQAIIGDMRGNRLLYYSRFSSNFTLPIKHLSCIIETQGKVTLLQNEHFLF